MKNKEADLRTQTKKLHSQSKSQISPPMQVNVLKSFSKFGTFLKEPMAQLSEPWKYQLSSKEFSNFWVFWPSCRKCEHFFWNKNA